MRWQGECKLWCLRIACLFWVGGGGSLVYPDAVQRVQKMLTVSLSACQYMYIILSVRGDVLPCRVRCVCV